MILLLMLIDTDMEEKYGIESGGRLGFRNMLGSPKNRGAVGGRGSAMSPSIAPSLHVPPVVPQEHASDDNDPDV
jgi:hypothetical protein